MRPVIIKNKEMSIFFFFFFSSLKQHFKNLGWIIEDKVKGCFTFIIVAATQIMIFCNRKTKSPNFKTFSTIIRSRGHCCRFLILFIHTSEEDIRRGILNGKTLKNCNIVVGSYRERCILRHVAFVYGFVGSSNLIWNIYLFI